MRILTLNALFTGDVAARLTALGRIIDEARYDVVCLQEVLYRRNARRVREMAGSYRYHAAAGGLTLKGGLVMLSRLPITGCRFVRYPITRPVRPEILMRKGIQYAMLAIAGRELAVLNTHLSANRDDDWSAVNRYARAQRVEFAAMARVVDALGPDVPIVAVGDFNAPPEAANAITVFKDAVDLTDGRSAYISDHYGIEAELRLSPSQNAIS